MTSGREERTLIFKPRRDVLHLVQTHGSAARKTSTYIRNKINSLVHFNNL